MAQNYGGKVYSVNDISSIQNSGDTGWYNFKIDKENCPVYVDQDYDGGGWVCVMANRRYTAGMNKLTYNDAINKANYRHNGTDDATNDKRMKSVSNLALADVNIWVGLKFWPYFGYRKEAGYINVVQYFAGTNGTALSSTASHSERHRWKFTGWTGNYAFTGGTSVANDVGSNTGMYSTHVLGGRGLTTFDLDQDNNGGNCATYYNNNPFWYTSCWSGNMFAGGSYVDGPYYTSSSSTYSRQYGALFIK